MSTNPWALTDDQLIVASPGRAELARTVIAPRAAEVDADRGVPVGQRRRIAAMQASPG